MEHLNPFERVVCINLDRRADRWAKFVEDLPEDWPFGEVERYAAVDGQRCQHPSWWRAGRGAWGCYRSHLNIIEECLNRGIESLLLLEDDAICMPDFSRHWSDYLGALPEDWEIAYLGGQHLYAGRHPPRRVNEYVVSPYDVNRTHAWSLRRGGLRIAYGRLTDVRDWQPGKHIDHRMGQLLHRRGVVAYAPTRWLLGQREGRSNVSGREFASTRFWQGFNIQHAEVRPKHVVQPEDFVIVVGLHRSGSSCMAGCVARLGVHMGNIFTGCEPDGGYEARDLARLCERAMPFPRFPMRLPGSKILDEVSKWVRQKQKEARKKRRLPGGKYPHLCALGRFFHDLLDEHLHVIHIDRPLDESVASLVRRSGRRVDAARLEAVQEFLWEAKRAFLATPDLHTITVQYDDLLEDPSAEMRRVADFLPADVSEQQILDAAAYVKPQLRHVQPQQKKNF